MKFFNIILVIFIYLLHYSVSVAILNMDEKLDGISKNEEYFSLNDQKESEILMEESLNNKMESMSIEKIISISFIKISAPKKYPKNYCLYI